MSAMAVLAKIRKVKAKLREDNPDLDLDELDALLEQDDSGEDDSDNEEEDEKLAAASAQDSKAVNQFALTADESDKVPELQGKNYVDFKLSKAEWSKIGKMHEVLQSWRNMDRFSDMKDSVNCGLENLEKWYRKTNDTDVYFICLALDPNYKTEYAEHQWDREPFINGMDKLKAKFDSYYKPPVTEHTTGSEPETSAGSVQYGHSWMRAAVKNRRAADYAKALECKEEEDCLLIVSELLRGDPAPTLVSHAWSKITELSWTSPAPQIFA
ncbi:hypothetical protein B0H13DRAFT_1888051 [Mycena leptocephala]|nr:hypothetical protein B0H13DRAFT_1888051 [Mycena leptocephala]